MIKPTIALAALMLTSCGTPSSSRFSAADLRYHTQEFQIVDPELPQPGYILGFVMDAPSPSRPTKVILWRSQRALTADRLAHATSVGVSKIDGKEFSPDPSSGSGIFTLHSDGRTTKLPIAEERATEIADAFKKGHEVGFAMVPRILRETGTIHLLSTVDRLE